MTKLMQKFLIHVHVFNTCTYFNTSTCFEQFLAHPQKVKLY